MSATNMAVVKCNVCANRFPPDIYNTDNFVECPSCRTEILSTVFPALYKQAEKGAAGELLLDDVDASCFYHADKKAAVTCEHCGRFLCNLCHIELREKHLCPGCVHVYREKGKLQSLDNFRSLHDEEALAWAILPLLFWPLTCVTPLVSIYITARYWKKPLSVIPRTRIRFVLAVIISLLQVAGWAAFIVFMTMTKWAGEH